MPNINIMIGLPIYKEVLVYEYTLLEFNNKNELVYEDILECSVKMFLTISSIIPELKYKMFNYIDSNTLIQYNEPNADIFNHLIHSAINDDFYDTRIIFDPQPLIPFNHIKLHLYVDK